MYSEIVLSPKTTTSVISYFTWADCVSDSPRSGMKSPEPNFESNTFEQEAEIIYHQEIELNKLENVAAGINRLDKRILKEGDNWMVIRNYTVNENLVRCNLCGENFNFEKQDKWFCSPTLRYHMYDKHKKRLRLRDDFNVRIHNADLYLAKHKAKVAMKRLTLACQKN